MSTEEENQPLLERNPPARGYNTVYIGFMLLGLGTLLPWNFFITADPYWQYKLRNVTNNSSTSDKGETTYLQNLYAPTLVLLSQITNALFLILNANFSHLIHHKKRLYSSLMTMIIFFSITTAMVKMDSDSWQTLFFVITMVIIFVMNASGAVFQGGLVGLAGMFPESHMCAMLGGQSLGGVFASAARIVSIFMGADAVSSAFIYFLIAVVVMLLTFFVYIYILKTDYFRHYANVASVHHDNDEEKNTVQVRPSRTFEIFKQIWPLAISVSFVFLVTLSVFPVICVRIVSAYSNKTWKDVYFQPVVTFLLFNIGDYFGRQCAGWLRMPSRGNKLLYLLTASRVVFIPLLLLCNHKSNSFPVLFESDVTYGIIMSLFSLSNGYFSTLAMMYAPRMVLEENAEKAGSIMVAMLGLGLLLGSGLSFAFALL